VQHLTARNAQRTAETRDCLISLRSSASTQRAGGCCL